MSDRVDAIRDRMNAATPGPWDWEYHEEDGVPEEQLWPHTLTANNGKIVLEACESADGDTMGLNVIDISVADAEFIACARRDMEYLFREIDQLTSILEEITDLDEEYRQRRWKRV